MEFVPIPWRSELYRQEVDLRDEILRRPLGLVFSEADLAVEEHEDHYGLVEAGQLIACVVIVTLSPTVAKLRQMAVAPARQRQGLGTTLIGHVERTLRDRGIEQVELHARETAAGFYEKLGYRAEGERFREVTIPHVKMAKAL
jgi:ribosomal protein S18 acetylase RimI-like enzyme